MFCSGGCVVWSRAQGQLGHAFHPPTWQVCSGSLEGSPLGGRAWSGRVSRKAGKLGRVLLVPVCRTDRFSWPNQTRTRRPWVGRGMVASRRGASRCLLNAVGRAAILLVSTARCRVCGPMVRGRVRRSTGQTVPGGSGIAAWLGAVPWEPSTRFPPSRGAERSYPLGPLRGGAEQWNRGTRARSPGRPGGHRQRAGRPTPGPRPARRGALETAPNRGRAHHTAAVAGEERIRRALGLEAPEVDGVPPAGPLGRLAIPNWCCCLALLISNFPPVPRPTRFRMQERGSVGLPPGENAGRGLRTPAPTSERRSWGYQQACSSMEFAVRFFSPGLKLPSAQWKFGRRSTHLGVGCK